MDNKYRLGQKVTAWFTFSDGHKEVQTTGTVQSIRILKDRPFPLYQLTGCADTFDGIFEAYENELTEAQND